MLRATLAEKHGEDFNAGTQSRFHQARSFDSGDLFGYIGMPERVAGKAGAKTLQPAILTAFNGFGKAWRRRAAGTHFGHALHAARVTNAFEAVKRRSGSDRRRAKTLPSEKASYRKCFCGALFPPRGEQKDCCYEKSRVRSPVQAKRPAGESASPFSPKINAMSRQCNSARTAFAENSFQKARGRRLLTR